MTKLTLLATVALSSLALATTAVAQVVTMATGAQGTLGYNSGQALGRVANDAGIIVRTQPLVGYMPLLQSGELDFGFANGAEAAYVYTATGNYDRAHPNMRLVGMMFPLTTGIMAPCDLGITNMDDLADRAGDLRLASEYISSTIIPFYIGGALASGGLTYEDFQHVPVSSFVEGIHALGDGLVDIALVSLNAGAGQQAAVKLQDRGGLCYISLNDSEEGIAAFQEFLPSGTLAALPQNDNIIGLQNYGATLIRVPWMLLTNAGVSEQLVYDIVRAIAENKETLGEVFGAFNRMEVSDMAPANLMPYHPGALRYYAEAGITVGE